VTTHQAGVVDTSIIAAIRLYQPAELPDTVLITASRRRGRPTNCDSTWPAKPQPRRSQPTTTPETGHAS
jgi:hypothetical protein